MRVGYRFGRARVRNAATSLLRQAPSVLRLFGRLLTDARVSVLDRSLVAGVIAYVISPWDMIPDFLAIIGVVDDLFLMGVALDRLLMRAPAQVVEEHWDGTPDGLRALTMELQAIGEALPNTLRALLHGQVARGAWGYADETAGEVYEGEAWPPAERAAARGSRGAEREVGRQDLDEAFDEDGGDGERIRRYRSRL